MQNQPGRAPMSQRRRYNRVQMDALKEMANRRMEHVNGLVIDRLIYENVRGLPPVLESGRLREGLQPETELGQHIFAFYEQTGHIQCPVEGCSAKYTNFTGVEKHQVKKHGKRTPFVCLAPGCFQLFHTATEGAAHAINVHGNSQENTALPVHSVPVAQAQTQTQMQNYSGSSLPVQQAKVTSSGPAGPSNEILASAEGPGVLVGNVVAQESADVEMQDSIAASSSHIPVYSAPLAGSSSDAGRIATAKKRSLQGGTSESQMQLPPRKRRTVFKFEQDKNDVSVQDKGNSEDEILKSIQSFCDEHNYTEDEKKAALSLILFKNPELRPAIDRLNL